MSDISNIVSSFKLQDKLNPKIWYLPNEKFMGDPNGQKYEMRPEVRARLLEVAYDYIESLDVDIVVSDILMTGSLANFNWSKYSDVDIHIVADYNQFPKDTQELYDELFRMKKTIYGLFKIKYCEFSSLQNKRLFAVQGHSINPFGRTVPLEFLCQQGFVFNKNFSTVKT